MLKIISPKILSSAIALALVSDMASAITVVDTTVFPPEASETLGIGNWAAGYFMPNNLGCPNGCDITGVSLLLDGAAYDALSPVSITGMRLELFSSVANPFSTIGFSSGSSLFTFTSPSNALFNGTFGTTINFSVPVQDSTTPALLQPNTGYWLRLTNNSQSPDVGWFFDGVDRNGQFWESSQFGDGSGTPFIFTVTGDARPSVVPLPGAVWMMGSALIGLLAVGRKRI